VQRGQKVVDTNGGGQRPVVIDPIPYPTEEVSACFINTYKLKKPRAKALI